MTDNRRRIRYSLVLVACLGLACHRPSPAPVPVPTPVPVPVPVPIPVPPPTPQPDDTAAELLKAHNAQREQRGLKVYTWNPQLQEAAQKHADYMARVGRMAHFGIGDGTPWSRIEAAGYAYSSAGENVAGDFRGIDSVMSAWMGSPGHRAAILSGSYTEFGGAVAIGSDGSRYWTTDFGAPGEHVPFGATPEPIEACVPYPSGNGMLVPAWPGEGGAR